MTDDVMCVASGALAVALDLDGGNAVQAVSRRNFSMS